MLGFENLRPWGNISSIGVHNGEIPAVRVGRSFRVPEDAVHKYLRSSYVDTA